MRVYTFKGGIQPNSRKELTKEQKIKVILPKGDLVYPLSKHGKNSALPLVVEGETVRKGQKIAEENGDELSVYASVSGTVKAIEQRLNPCGVEVNSIVIENDGTYQEVEYEHGNVVIKDAESIRYILANLIECEPYVTSTYRRMVECTEELFAGMKAMLQQYKNAFGIFCVADDKMDCVAKLQEMIDDEPQINIRVLKRKYPQENEQLLAITVLGRKKCNEGLLVVSAEELIAGYRKMITGEPITERVVTVSGSGVKEPGNFKVLLGTSHRTLVEAAGGLVDDVDKVISGGIMTGTAIATLDVPVTKDTTAILCMKQDTTETMDIKECIKCGRCVEVCPMGLVPAKLAFYAEESAEDKFVKWNGTRCIECGCCTYKCPSKRPLKQLITAMKQNGGC